jgi:translocation and assembly module TamA
VHWERDPQMSASSCRRLTDDAVREAREAAATEGWFSARVEARIDDSIEPKVVRLRVEPGERTRVGEVEIRFRGPPRTTPRRRTRSSACARPGTCAAASPFRQADWEAAKRAACAKWRPGATPLRRSPTAAATIDPQSARASLMVDIESGPPFRFGELRVSGRAALPGIGGEQPQPDPPGRRLRPRQGPALPAAACSRPATSPACRPTSTRSRASPTRRRCAFR